jgi:hypothetical protein
MIIYQYTSRYRGRKRQASVRSDACHFTGEPVEIDTEFYLATLFLARPYFGARELWRQNQPKKTMRVQTTGRKIVWDHSWRASVLAHIES